MRRKSWRNTFRNSMQIGIYERPNKAETVFSKMQMTNKKHTHTHSLCALRWIKESLVAQQQPISTNQITSCYIVVFKMRQRAIQLIAIKCLLFRLNALRCSKTSDACQKTIFDFIQFWIQSNVKIDFTSIWWLNSKSFIFHGQKREWTKNTMNWERKYQFRRLEIWLGTHSFCVNQSKSKQWTTICLAFSHTLSNVGESEDSFDSLARIQSENDTLFL